MKQEDIYSLIEESIDDKIKLDFDDVKNRIAKLEDKESAKIVVLTPSAERKKNIIKIISAAAACLVCIIGLSVAFSGMSGAKSDNAMNETMMNDAAKAADYYNEETIESEGIADDFCFGDADETESAVDSIASIGECVLSDSDMSNSDIVSQTDHN